MLRPCIFLSLLLGGNASCLWEWAGVYHAHEGGMLTWTFEKKGTTPQYADPGMAVALRSASAATEAGLTAVKSSAETDLNGTLTTVQSGAVLSLNAAYQLQFDTDSWISIFKIPVTAESNFAVFAAHNPSEFKNQMPSVMRNDHGESVSASHTAACDSDDHDHDHHDDHAETSTDRIGEVIAGSLMTALPTLVGIVLLAVSCNPTSTSFKTALHFSNSLAAGILLAAAVFLFLPEAQHMLAVGKTEPEAAAAWGSTIVAGWLVGAISHLAGDVVKQKCGAEDSGEQKDDVVAANEAEKPPARNMMWVLGIPIFCGDFCCNIADGFVLGTAFRACSAGSAWKLVGIIIAHELPQEVADIYTLVFKAGMKWWQATLLNFICGCASVLGAIIAYYSNIPYEAEGTVLCLAGGVFLYVSLTELAPAVSSSKRFSSPLVMSAATVFVFIVGAACIGLILLDHEHCSAGGGHGDTHGDTHGDANGGH